MPVWIGYSEDRRRIALEGLYLFACKLRVAHQRGLDPIDRRTLYEHIIAMCENAGLRESAITHQHCTADGKHSPECVMEQLQREKVEQGLAIHRAQCDAHLSKRKRDE